MIFRLFIFFAKNSALFLLITASGKSIASASSKISLKFCADENPQYPYVIMESKDSDVTGVYPDLLSELAAVFKEKYNIEIERHYYLLPWSRCLLMLKSGDMDVALTASYKEDRAEYLNYPDGASTEEKPCTVKNRITCNEHVILTYKSLAPYIYDGDPKLLPRPVRATRGYSVVSDLEKEGVKVESAPGEKNSLLQLLRDKTGSAVVTGVIARNLLKDKQYSDYLILQDKPFIKKSYYIPFSKKSKIDPNTQKKIWDIVGDLNEGSKRVFQLMEKYDKND